MESIQPQLEDLISSIDDLESSLQPIIQTALSASTSKLPLLDKAKLYVLATYALESILFSFLRLNDVDAKSHAVFQELNRVKEYFAKIKTAEEIGAGGRSAGAGRLDKEAAGRFIKAGLSGNDKYDRERKERQEREKAGAKRKLESMSVGTHTRFDGSAKRIKAQEEEGEKVNVVSAADTKSEEDGSVELPQGTTSKPKRRREKKRHDPLDVEGNRTHLEKSKTKKKKGNKMLYGKVNIPEDNGRTQLVEDEHDVSLPDER